MWYLELEALISAPRSSREKMIKSDMGVGKLATKWRAVDPISTFN